MKTDYTGITLFLKNVEDINTAATGKEKKGSPNAETMESIIKYRRWYRSKHPKATEREITRAVNRKFWGSN